MTTRTGSNVFGTGIGLADQLGITLAKQGVTPQMIHSANADPTRGASIGAAFRGDISLGQITLDELIAREISYAKAFCEVADVPGFRGTYVEAALRYKESVAGVISVHDRYIPGNLTRRQLLGINCNLGIKIYQNDPKVADCDGEAISTEQGVFQCDFMSMMTPTDADHRPFMLDYDQQWSWATEQGGNGFSSAEQALYAILRAKLELGRIPFMGGSLRCRNAGSSGCSLGVLFSAGDGLGVYDWDRSDRYWYLGALPWKYWGL